MRRRATHAIILKQKQYNFTTNTLKAYLSVQASFLSAFVISRTHISGQKPRGRQVNAKVYGSISAIYLFFLRYDFCSDNDNSKTAQALTLILARNECSSQRATSQPLSDFIASNFNKSHSQHSEVAVRYEGPSNFVRMRTCSLVPSIAAGQSSCD